MSIRRLTIGFIAAVTLQASTSAVAFGSDPIGESADYVVDRSSRRTSSMVQSGTLRAEVTAALPDYDPPAYEVTLDYSFRIQLIGTREGTEILAFDNLYFTPEFLTRLRVEREYQSTNFKVRHIGYADARNLDGKVYRNCDKILIYDVVAAEASGLTQLAAALFGAPTANEIEDLEIVAHISYGQPVIGAVKLDMNGTYRGRAVKVGADYESP